MTVVVAAMADSMALRACLSTIQEQAQSLEGEVLLIMNTGSGELAIESRKALEGLCSLLLFEPQIGKSHALNTAVSLSRGTVIAFTDDDAQPQSNWLAALTAPLLALNRDPTLVGCGGPVLPIYPEGPIPNWFLEMVMNKPNNFLTPTHDLGRAPLDYGGNKKGWRTPPLGSNCAYRREIFNSYYYDPELGPNRETGLRGGEDALLGKLLLGAGYRLVYCPDAIVHHPVLPERMTKEVLRQSFYVHGIEAVRISLALGGDPYRQATKLRRKSRKLHLKLILGALFSWSRRLQTTHMQRIAKYDFICGQLAELRRCYGRKSKTVAFHKKQVMPII